MPHPPYSIPALCVAAFLACLIGAPPGGQALAQTLEQRGFEPLDQTVEDTGPLRRSLRRVEMGLRQLGQESRVYRRPNSDDPDKLYYISQGIVAEFDRSRYARLRNGRVLQLIPPNTIFHIGLPPREESPDPPPDHPLRIDTRLDRRIGGHSAAAARAPAYLARRAGHLAHPHGEANPADRTDWRNYRRFLEAQRQSVMRAIGRAAAADSP